MTLLLSDNLGELLGTRRPYRDEYADVAVLGLEPDQIGWWNDVGRLAGIVVLVGSWAAAGVVGNSVYNALRAAMAAAAARRTEAATPLSVVSASEAEAMARWVICAEFHCDECNCPSAGHGHQAAVGIIDDRGELASTEPYDFVVRLVEALVEDGVWSIVLKEEAVDTSHLAFECEVTGIAGSTFFVGARRRALEYPEPPPWPKLAALFGRAVERHKRYAR